MGSPAFLATAGLATVDSCERRRLGCLYKGILLDVGGVLYFDDPVELAYSWRTVVHLRSRGYKREIGPVDIIRLSRGTALRYSDLNPDDWRFANSAGWADTIDAWPELMLPIPGAIEGMKGLRPARIAIVANQPRETLSILERDGVLALCDWVELDCLSGVSKPDSEIFQSTLRGIQVKAKAGLMIGDRLDNDIEPARSLGLHTLLLPRRLWAGRITGSIFPDTWHDRYRREMTFSPDVREGKAVGETPTPAFSRQLCEFNAAH